MSIGKNNPTECFYSTVSDSDETFFVQAINIVFYKPVYLSHTS